VEEKGYKNMIKLPDWKIIQRVFIKFEKRSKTGEFLLFCPLFFL
jgi:hypothetical protein